MLMDTTAADLKEDFEELEMLCVSAQTKLEAHLAHVAASGGAYQPAVAEHLFLNTRALRDEYSSLRDDIKRQNLDDSGSAIRAKRGLRARLRVLQSSLGSVLSAGNWQSPSVRHTDYSQAGNETGSIETYRNDYKRDRHRDEKIYAKQFISNYVDHPGRLAPICFATSSGMAAVLTVLVYLRGRVKPEAAVLAGTNTYFQSKWILENTFPSRVVYADDSSADAYIAAVKEHKPAIVFLDTISNNAYSMLDVSKLLPELSRALPRSSTIVLDNTGLGVMSQPLRDMPIFMPAPKLIVVESLSKYHQFGLDRVNGGVIWFPHWLLFPGLNTARSNAGTIMPDTSVLSQPEPNRLLLERRFARIGRNALRLARYMEEIARTPRSPIARVVYPGLATHPAYEWSHARAFHGGFFSCEFSSLIITHVQREHILKKLFSEAAKRKVPIVHGAGFGFDTTRLYILPEISGVQRSVLRISAGTETAQEIEALCEVLSILMR